MSLWTDDLTSGKYAPCEIILFNRVDADVRKQVKQEVTLAIRSISVAMDERNIFFGILLSK